MPEIDGFDLARLVKRRERTRGVPILFLTAVGEDLRYIYEAYSAGAVDYLVKPVDPAMVRVKVSVFADLWRKGREIARQKGEERSRELLETIPQIVFLASPEGLVNYVNRRWRDYTGADPDGGLGPGAFESVHPDDVAAVAERWKGAVAAREPFQVEFRLRRSDGAWRWHLCQVRPETPAREWLGTLTDIDDQNRIQGALEAAHRRASFLARAGTILAGALDVPKTLASLAELAVPELADWCIVDVVEGGRLAEPIVAHVDPAMVEFVRDWRRRYPVTLDDARGVGLVLRTAEGRLYREVTWDDLREAARSPESLERLRALGLSSAMTVPIVARGGVLGAIRFVRAQAGAPYVPSDFEMARELGCRAGLALENARLYAEARRAVDLRDEFLSIASHELRTPLTSLQLHVQTLLRELRKGLAPEALAARLSAKEEVTGRQFQRLTKLVDELLDVSRIQAGRLRLELEACDVSSLVTETALRQRPELERAGCEVRLAVARGIEAVVDPLRIEQVVSNLLSNAARYAPGAPVDVLLEQEDRTVRLVVRDQGPGIPAEQRDAVFERFVRAGPPETAGGLGLGLYIARQIVTAHGGSIRAWNPGKGAAFTIELPTTPTTAEEAGAPCLAATRNGS